MSSVCQFPSVNSFGAQGIERVGPGTCTVAVGSQARVERVTDRLSTVPVPRNEKSTK
jgi:hypothetical protein